MRKFYYSKRDISVTLIETVFKPIKVDGGNFNRVFSFL